MEGKYEGTNRKGKTYTAQTTKVLKFKGECWLQGFFKPSSGTIELKSENKTAILDFGDGACDNIFTITVNGHTKEING